MCMLLPLMLCTAWYQLIHPMHFDSFPLCLTVLVRWPLCMVDHRWVGLRFHLNYWCSCQAAVYLSRRVYPLHRYISKRCIWLPFTHPGHTQITSRLHLVWVLTTMYMFWDWNSSLAWLQFPWPISYTWQAMRQWTPYQIYTPTISLDLQGCYHLTMCAISCATAELVYWLQQQPFKHASAGLQQHS